MKRIKMKTEYFFFKSFQRDTGFLNLALNGVIVFNRTTGKALKINEQMIEGADF